WVSERNLVAALSNAGGFGAIASGALMRAMLADENGDTAALTDRQFGVNLITLHQQLPQLNHVCVAQPVRHDVLAGECPNAAAIGRGEAVLSYLEMGAAGVQLGTRFVCAYESIAHPRFKRAFIRAAARDAMPSPQLDARFPVIPVRALINPASDRFRAIQREVIDRFGRRELSQKDAQLEIEHFWAGAL